MSTKDKAIKSFKIFYWSLIQFILLIASGFVIFIIYAMSGMAIPYQDELQSSDEKIKVFVRSNGMHTDICLPIKNRLYDWWSFFDQTDYPNENYKWVAMGWGDKDFYIETETWDDMNTSTLAQALFLPTQGAMHVEMLYDEPAQNENCAEVDISIEGYMNLAAYMGGSFYLYQWEPHIIEGASYYERDRFYFSKRDYHMMELCNSWTNQGLKYAGVRTASWAVFPSTILNYLKK